MDVNEVDVLVAGPGGIKGFLELGALYFLDKYEKLKKTNCYIGVSVGSIICLLYNIGLTPKEIIYFAILNQDIIDIDISNLDFTKLLRDLKNNWGLSSTDKIKSILSKVIKEKIGYVPTLRQLYERTGKELVIVSFSISEKKTIYFSYKEYPNLSCVEAVSYSILIPFIFFRAVFNGALMQDGAFGDPYPVLLKDDGRNNILGLYVETDISENIFNNPLIYFHEVFHCLFSNMTQRNITDSSTKCKHIMLKSDIMDTIGATVTITDKAKMILIGIETTKKSYS